MQTPDKLDSADIDYDDSNDDHYNNENANQCKVS